MYPVKVPAIRVHQPLGEFYLANLPAGLLLEVTYSDPLRVTEEGASGTGYLLQGAQRDESIRKLRDIGRFLETTEAAFPNSIILGANYSESGILEEESSIRWRVDANGSNDILSLTIPSESKVATIIDGQHRLHGFKYANADKLSIELPCSIYLDLPNPYQAYLFATINFNQKKVDRSLAYELFGFNIEEEPPESWSPDKTAVFLCRKLNTDVDSAFYRHIIVAAQNDEVLFRSKAQDTSWAISTATVVDGLLRLFSSNPKKDRDLMHQKKIAEGRNRGFLEQDLTPLRQLYLAVNDLAIYTITKNFFTAVSHVFWSRAQEVSYIKKTVGIQALFDILRQLLLRDFAVQKAIGIKYFQDNLSKNGVAEIDFANPFFQASGIGRKRIRNIIGYRTGLVSENELRADSDIETYRSLK